MAKTQKLLQTVVLNMTNRYKDELPNIVSATVRMEKLAAPQLGGMVGKISYWLKWNIDSKLSQ